MQIYIETESRLVVAYGWGNMLMCRVSFGGQLKCSEVDCSDG